MKRTALIFLLLASWTYSNASNLVLETESFENYGGWVLNHQYMDQMGSPYLMAHGIGRAVEDATHSFFLKETGTYFIMARTFNWTSPWTDKPGAGQFKIKLDGKPLDGVLGATGNKWEWQEAGQIRLERGQHVIALYDLTGFDGRCDAIILCKSRGKDLDAIRTEQLAKRPVNEGEFDFVVAGGGIAGMCAAVSAARLGLKTALIHDRGVLGGNNSSEIRVHTSGVICQEPYPNLGLTMREFGHGRIINGENDGNLYRDDKKAAFVAAEPNLKVFYNMYVMDVDTKGDMIKAVIAQDTKTGQLHKLSAKLFSDCTGDACLGYLAGAEYRMGREARSLTGERSAVRKADSQVMGASVLWNTIQSEDNDFPLFEYGLNFSDESVHAIKNGEWTWETGMNRDQIREAEYIRDYGMLVAYSNWSYLKNKSSKKDDFRDRKLNWVSYIAGKRESRRLMGEYVLNQNDILARKSFEDATVTIGWPIDLHYPDPRNGKYFPGNEFISVCNQEVIELMPIPYRCFYSKNVRNLFMAGRNISVTHAALGTVRVMRTTCMMGEVVGMAASVCKNRKCLPGEVYSKYLEDLKDLMKKGVGDPSLPDNQNFHLGRSKVSKHKYSSPDID